jgi:uncharacterized membrane protein
MPYSPDTPLQTPVSFIGGTVRVARLWASDQTGWRRFGRHVGVIVLMLCMWLVSVIFYVIMLGFAILFVPWTIYTLNRRHHIHDARRAAAIRGDRETT